MAFNGSSSKLLLRLTVTLGCAALAAALRVRRAVLVDARASEAAGSRDEPLHVTFLRLSTTFAAAALIAQLLLVRRRSKPQLDLPADPAMTLREELGVSKLAPVHRGRAKTSVPPILEGTSRTGTNADNPRNLSFLSSADAPPATPAAATEQPPSAEKKALPQYTLAEVAKHCTKDDAWIIVDERVYDVTRFIDKHPGGVGPMINLAGRDCTDVFGNYHSQKVYSSMLPAFLIGEMAEGEIAVWPHVADFRRIRQELLRRGLFETDMGYYAKMFAWQRPPGSEAQPARPAALSRSNLVGRLPNRPRWLRRHSSGAGRAVVAPPSPRGRRALRSSRSLPPRHLLAFCPPGMRCCGSAGCTSRSASSRARRTWRAPL